MTLLNAGFVTVSIRDSGTGLSSENISRLFQEGVQFNANELQVRRSVPINI
jgi:signal transduction histidine kinase